MIWRRSRVRKKPRQTKTLAWQLFFGFLTIGFVVLSGFGLRYVTALPEFSITEISVNGGQAIPNESIKFLIEEKLKGRYMQLISRNFSYLYPEEIIISSIKAIPQVKEVVITKVSRNHIDVTFLEYFPHALWCRGEVEICAFIDDEGHAFVEAPQLAGGVYVRYFIEQDDLNIGSNVLSFELLKKTEEFIRTLYDEFSFRIGVVTISKDNDITYESNRGGSIITAFDTSKEIILENLKLIFSSQEFSHLEFDNFNYIDTRFGNKIFVKEEFGIEEVVGTTTEDVTVPES